MQSGKEMLPFYLVEEVWSIPRLKPRSTLLPHTTSLKQTRKNKQALSRSLPRMAFHSLFYTLCPQDRIKPHPGMFCLSDSDHLWVSFSFWLCISTHFVLINDFSSTVIWKVWCLKPKTQNEGCCLKCQALNTKVPPAENEGFSCLERGYCWDVPVINYRLPLGIGNLGQLLANTEWHRKKGTFQIVPWLQARLVIKW